MNVKCSQVGDDRNIRIMLLNPPPENRRDMHDTPGHPHLGLAYISGYLKSKGINCTAIDAKFEMIELAGLERRLLHINELNERPDVVGITAMTHEISQANKIAQTIKTIWPHTTTVIGGAHATALPYRTLAEFPYFDVAVFGEGEHTFYELVIAIKKQQSLKEIKGICYRETEEICINEPRDPIGNIAELPYPDWQIFPRSNTYPIITTRGCPFKCNFCMRVLGNTVRKRTPQDVLNEIEDDISVYGASYLIFDDESFVIDKKYGSQVLDMMVARGLHSRIRWWCNTRVDLVDLELLKKMKAAGCIWIGYGIESGNDEILKATKKGITLKQAEEVIKMTKEVGLGTGSYFIIGHPFETRKTIQDTIRFATKLNTTTVAFGIMVPYPGTEIYQTAKQGEGSYKIISENWADYNKTIGNSMELATLNRTQLEMLQLWAYFRFYIINLRLIDFVKLFWAQRRVVFSVTQKILVKLTNPVTGGKR